MRRFLCARWSGPISVAVVGDQFIATEAVCGSSKPHPSASVLRAKIDQSLRWRGALLLGTTTTMQLFSYAGNYPINALRNAALNAITTSHVLVVDVDLFPSTELHEAILAQSLYLKNHPRSALVVPAFQRKGNWRGYSDSGGSANCQSPTSFPKPSPSCSIV